MCVGDLVSFDPPNRTKCNQLPGSWSCSWSLQLLQEGWGWLGTIKGCDSASEGVQLRVLWLLLLLNPLSSSLAKEPEQLHQNSEYKLHSLCCAVLETDANLLTVFRRTSMDLRGITNSATCWLLSGILPFHYAIFTFSPWLLLHGFFENLLYPEIGFSQWSIMQMLKHSLNNRKKRHLG